MEIQCIFFLRRWTFKDAITNTTASARHGFIEKCTPEALVPQRTEEQGFRNLVVFFRHFIYSPLGQFDQAAVRRRAAGTTTPPLSGRRPLHVNLGPLCCQPPDWPLPLGAVSTFASPRLVTRRDNGAQLRGGYASRSRALRIPNLSLKYAWAGRRKLIGQNSFSSQSAYFSSSCSASTYAYVCYRDADWVALHGDIPPWHRNITVQCHRISIHAKDLFWRNAYSYHTFLFLYMHTAPLALQCLRMVLMLPSQSNAAFNYF